MESIVNCQMQQPVKVEICPICDKPLEEYGAGLACLTCKVFVNTKTGEIKRFQQQGIIKNVIGKLKNFLWM